MMTLDDFMKDQMKDPEFAKAYEEIQPEMSVIRAIVEARTSQNLTQKELESLTMSLLTFQLIKMLVNTQQLAIFIIF